MKGRSTMNKPIKQKKTYERIRADSGQHKRIFCLMAVLGILAFVPSVLQLHKLMILEQEYYKNLALRNQTRTTTVTAERGIIYDRNMDILACNQSVENIYLDPHELKQSKADMALVSNSLGQILELDPEWIRQQGKDTTKRYKQIAAGVEEETAAQIREFINTNGISGIHIEPSLKRYYPKGKLASQIVGFTNLSNVGSEGIEASYNSYLSGIPGKVITSKGNNEMDMPFSYEN